jgi:multidrug efflux pump subunit AcrA (membrane-fusion protein)
MGKEKNMAETPDISEAKTMPAMAALSSDTSAPETPTDFEPLIDNLDDSDFMPLPHLPRARRSRRWLPWLIAGVLVVLIGGGILVALRASRSTPVQYTQATATIDNLTVTAAGSGPVVPHATYNLNFSASAPITTIYVKVGDRVTKGQKLASLDPTTLQESVNQAQNTVNADQNSLNEAETNLTNVQTQEATALNIAKLNEDKALAACSPITTSPTPTPSAATATATAEATCEQLAQQQYVQAQEQANAAITSANNQVTSAQQQLTNAQTALNTAQNNLNNATLLAPHAGLIEAVNGLVGETINGGNSSASSGSSGGSSANGGGSGNSSAFIVLIDDSSLGIQAAVSEADIASIQVNQPATFTVAAYPSQTFNASVASINTLGTTSSNVVTYTVDLAVDLQSLNGAHIYAGMTATTSITTAERISTLLVPSSALTFSTTALQNGEITSSQLRDLISGGNAAGTTGKRGIVIELKAGKLVPVLVTTGLTNGQQTEILSGLNEGDEVVVGQTGGASSPSGNGGSRNGGGGFGGGGSRFIGGGN